MLIDDRLISKPLYDSQCLRCEHLIEGPAGARCKAYPNGIDAKFILNETIHDKVIPDQEGEYIFKQKSFAKSLSFFGKIITLFKGLQENLFTGQTDEHGNQLLPSNKNPNVRRYQKNNRVDEADFKTLDEANDWILKKEKEYGSKDKFLASDEYKKAYPKIRELYQKNKADYVKKGQEALRIADQKEGDKVEYSAANPFGEVTVYEGKIVMRDNIPFVKLNQKTNDGKSSIRWHKGFKKIKTGASISEFAKQLHQDQKYGDEGNYFDHHIKPVLAAALKLGEGRNDLSLIEKVAYLHDAIEDTLVNEEDIKKLFGKDVLTEVKLLSKYNKKTGKRITDDEYYKKISKSEVAKIVKNADRLENIKSLPNISEKRRREKLTKEYSSEIPIFEKYGMGVGLKEAMEEAVSKGEKLNESEN